MGRVVAVATAVAVGKVVGNVKVPVGAAEGVTTGPGMEPSALTQTSTLVTEELPAKLVVALRPAKRAPLVSY